MDAVQVIKELAGTTSRNDKETILENAWLAGERNFFIGAKLAYDPMITFGVAKVAELVEDDGVKGTFTFKDLLALAEKLRKRELTGNAARDAINSAAENSSFDEWNLFYRRILLKDLRAGLEEKTINKVLAKIAKKDASANQYIVPIFSCQLAQPAEDNPKKMKGKKMVDVKLDGVRLLTILDKESRTIKQYTRNGKENNNFQGITNSLIPLLDQIPVSIVLDGEVVSRNFQDLMTQVNRKADVDTSDAKLALFDIVPLADFKAGICKITQEERHKNLVGLTPILQKITSGTVYVIPKMTIDLDTPEGQEAMRQFNIETLAAGYEGIMIKDPQAPYETKRTSAWLKIKPVITVDLAIVDMEEGTGKYAGMLGALVCEGEDAGKKIRTNVGSGLTDDQRKEMWAKRKELIGEIVEIKADTITKDRTEDEFFSLRFPRFERFRGINRGEKL